ncbi:TPA: enoyl-CoA hydratase-related protein [Escherichia coli]
MMEFILSHVEKGVMTLTLNRPERLNSFNDEMHTQLAECLKQVERDDTIRCLLITGAGRGFCAGQDLNDRNVDPTGPAPDLGMSVERFYNPLVRRLAKLPKPVICAVNGVAAGAGATLARHLATQPTFGLGLIKQAINSAETNTLDTQLDLERDYQRLAGRSADYREGVSALLAKRSPQFTGK